MSRLPQIPVYRLHKQSGQAVVTLTDGPGGRRRDFLLGRYGTAESRQEYTRVLAEWEANGRRLISTSTAASAPDLTVNEMLLQFWRWANRHYRDSAGEPSRELENLLHALRPLRRLYGHASARDFGPLALRCVQEDMIKAGLSRNVVNGRVNRVRRVFKWAASFEVLPASVYQALRTVPGLRRGQTEVREMEPIRPVCDEHVRLSLPFLSTPVRAMVQLQRLTGCRPGEVMKMRGEDLSTAGTVWLYRPGSHKTTHYGRDRVIFLGPQAQEILKPFLTTSPEVFLFSPRVYVESLHARRAVQRTTRRTPSELRLQRKREPKRAPGERYTRRSYRLAIIRACVKAGVTPWTPLQLRHTAATEIRARYGVEAARVILGHSKVETSQIYAERDLVRAQEIMGEIG